MLVTFAVPAAVAFAPTVVLGVAWNRGVVVLTIAPVSAGVMSVKETVQPSGKSCQSAVMNTLPSWENERREEIKSCLLFRFHNPERLLIAPTSVKGTVQPSGEELPEGRDEHVAELGMSKCGVTCPDFEVEIVGHEKQSHS